MSLKGNVPNKAVMGAPGISLYRARAIAVEAARNCRSFAPKASIQSSSHFVPIYGEGYFGVEWQHPYVYFQEVGINPFTMRSLAGKTIPMWLNDPNGELQRKNPKAKVRKLADGRTQVQVFRRAARIGQQKRQVSMVNGQLVHRFVPASYPGAPGRIAVNRSQGILRQGDVDPNTRNRGWIAAANNGVRWRHPGLNPRGFLARGLHEAAVKHGLPVSGVQYLDRWNTGAPANYATLVYGG